MTPFSWPAGRPRERGAAATAECGWTRQPARTDRGRAARSPGSLFRSFRL